MSGPLKIWINIVAMLLIFFLVYGFLAPMLVSAASTVSVAAGFALAIAVGPVLLFWIGRRTLFAIRDYQVSLRKSEDPINQEGVNE